MEVIVLVVYITICFILLVYSLVEFTLLLNYLFRKQNLSKKPWDELPHVTIQLPVYNESYVIERLIDKIAEMDYPNEKLEIQVLDDSSDDTIEKAKAKVEHYRNKGLDIQYIQREDRVGYKAGALDYGLKTAEGEFIAIFDADFLPSNDFLMKIMPYFDESNVGVVQSRWTYINENFSLLTKVQTVMLNTHFSVEHAGRNRSGAFINFNGTGGVWRKACIEDAGGWHADTLTEDLDLSFRAQLRDWKFKYAMEIESPSELPVTYPGYKSQQFRWAKGAAECTKKNMGMLWKEKNVNFWPKLIGSFQLLNSSVFLIVFGLILISFPLTYSLQQFPKDSAVYSLLKATMIPNLFLMLVFIGGNLGTAKNKVTTLALFPFYMISFLVVNMSVSLYMTVGVIEGYLGRKSEFVRTPKFNVLGRKKGDVSKYTNVKLTPLFLVEFLLIAYGVFQFFYAYSVGDFFAMVFATMFTLGFGYAVCASLYYSSRA